MSSTIIKKDFWKFIVLFIAFSGIRRESKRHPELPCPFPELTAFGKKKLPINKLGLLIKYQTVSIERLLPTGRPLHFSNYGIHAERIARSGRKLLERLWKLGDQSLNAAAKFPNASTRRVNNTGKPNIAVRIGV